MSETLSSSVLLDGIRSLILSARRSAARGVNLLQVYTNYEIGRRIVEQEQRGTDRAEYGKQVLKELPLRRIWEWLFSKQPRVYAPLLPRLSQSA